MKEENKHWLESLPKHDGLLSRLEKKDNQLKQFHDLQSPLRQGFMLAEDIVKQWCKEFYPLSNSDKNAHECDASKAQSMGEPLAQNLTSELEDFHKELEKEANEFYPHETRIDERFAFKKGWNRSYSYLLPKLTEYKSLIEKLKEELKNETDCVEHMKEVCDEYQKQIHHLKEENEKLWQTLKLIRSVYPDQLEKLETGLERLQQETQKQSNDRGSSNISPDAGKR